MKPDVGLHPTMLRSAKTKESNAQWTESPRHQLWKLFVSYMLSHWTFQDLSHLGNGNHNHTLKWADEVEMLSEYQRPCGRVITLQGTCLLEGFLITFPKPVHLERLVLVGLLRMTVCRGQPDTVLQGDTAVSSQAQLEKKARVKPFSSLRSHGPLRFVVSAPQIYLL